ncbi:unnamed protein product [Ixodes hexagonus]
MASNLAYSLLDFGLELYKKLLVQTGGTANIFYSPLSIAAALSMTLAGARHGTAKQIEHAMHLDGVVHKHFADVLSKIDGFAPDVVLQVANGLYSDRSVSILPAYATLLKELYNTTMKPVDFRKDPTASRLEINTWVKEVTQSKIKDLLPERSIDFNTVLVIVSAIYFEGLWRFKFNPQATSPKEFNETKDRTRTVQMMYTQVVLPMTRIDNLSVLEIPYQGMKTSMVILLPDEVDGLPALEKTLTASTLTKILGDLKYKTEVYLYLPRFKLEQTTDLKATLMAMGIHDLFTTSADLSGMSDDNNLKISAAVHKAFVEVNEKGTEAAEASELELPAGYRVYSAPVTVDHPFLFVIRSHNPDVILFIGSVRHI